MISSLLILPNQIFAYASPTATLSEQLIEKIKSSGLGMITKWSPQQFILSHPVLPSQFVTCVGSILKNSIGDWMVRYAWRF